DLLRAAGRHPRYRGGRQSACRGQHRSGRDHRHPAHDVPRPQLRPPADRRRRRGPVPRRDQAAARRRADQRRSGWLRPDETTDMRVAITGSSGLIGTALRGSLKADGHEIVRLVRRPAEAPDEVQWDPAQGRLDVHRLQGIDGMVNLAGASVGAQRWTDAHRRTIRSRRANATRTVAETSAKLDNPPRVLVSASGVSYYGTDHGSEMLD